MLIPGNGLAQKSQSPGWLATVRSPCSDKPAFEEGTAKVHTYGRSARSAVYVSLATKHRKPKKAWSWTAVWGKTATRFFAGAGIHRRQVIQWPRDKVNIREKVKWTPQKPWAENPGQRRFVLCTGLHRPGRAALEHERPRYDDRHHRRHHH